MLALYGKCVQQTIAIATFADETALIAVDKDVAAVLNKLQQPLTKSEKRLNK